MAGLIMQGFSSSLTLLFPVLCWFLVGLFASDVHNSVFFKSSAIKAALHFGSSSSLHRPTLKTIRF